MSARGFDALRCEALRRRDHSNPVATRGSTQPRAKETLEVSKEGSWKNGLFTQGSSWANGSGRSQGKMLVVLMTKKLIDVKASAVFEHEVDGPSEFVCENGVGLELTHLGFQAVGISAEQRMMTFGQDGCFAQGPAQVGIAQFGSAQPLDLAGAGHGSLDQTAVAAEALNGGKAVDVLDFVENGQGQRLSDTRDGLEQGVIAGGDAASGGEQLGFQFEDHFIVVADHGQVGLERGLVVGIGEGLGQALAPRLTIAAAAGHGFFTLGQLETLQALEQFGSAPHVGDALTEQSADGSFLGGVDIGGRDEIAAEQMGQLLRIDPVVLVLAAVDGADVKGMSEDEVEAGAQTGIGQPIPAEEALATDSQRMTPGSDLLEEEVEVVVANVGMEELFALAVHQTGVHGTGMQIDSAVEFGGGFVVSHGWFNAGGELPLVLLLGS